MNVYENESDVVQKQRSVKLELIKCNLMEELKNENVIETKNSGFGYGKIRNGNITLSHISDINDCPRKGCLKSNEEISYYTHCVIEANIHEFEDKSLHTNTRNTITLQTDFENVDLKSGSFDTVMLNCIRSPTNVTCGIISNIFRELQGLYVFYFGPHARKIFAPITLKNIILPVLKDPLGSFLNFLSTRMTKCTSNIFLKKAHGTNHSVVIRYKCISTSVCKFFSSFKELNLHNDCKYNFGAIANNQLQKIITGNSSRISQHVKTTQSDSLNKNCSRNKPVNCTTNKKRSAPDFDDYTATSDVKKIRLERGAATETLYVIDDAFDTHEHQDINDPKFIKVSNINDAFIAVKNQWSLQYESNPHLDLTVRRSLRPNLFSNYSPILLNNVQCPITLFDNKIQSIDDELRYLNRHICMLYQRYNVSIRNYYVLCEINRQIDQCKRDEARLKNEYASLCDARDEVKNLYKFYLSFNDEYNISQYQNTENGNKRKDIDLYDVFYGANI